jgi:hypothetical protein
MDPNMPERLFTTLMLVRGNNNIIAYNTTGFTEKSVRRPENIFHQKNSIKIGKFARVPFAGLEGGFHGNLRPQNRNRIFF